MLLNAGRGDSDRAWETCFCLHCIRLCGILLCWNSYFFFFFVKNEWIEYCHVGLRNQNMTTGCGSARSHPFACCRQRSDAAVTRSTFASAYIHFPSICSSTPWFHLPANVICMTNNYHRNRKINHHVDISFACVYDDAAVQLLVYDFVFAEWICFWHWWRSQHMMHCGSYAIRERGDMLAWYIEYIIWQYGMQWWQLDGKLDVNML